MKKEWFSAREKTGSLALFFMLCILFPGCKSDKDDPVVIPVVHPGMTFPAEGAMKINIDHAFGDAAFLFEPNTFITTPLDTINATELTYYVSNVSLQKENGEYINMGNYHLVDYVTSGSNTFSIPGIPAGYYKKLRFYLGIDSSRNHSGAQTGALDPGYGMLWNWSTGYIFLKLSGRFNNNKAYSFHVGGDQNLPVIELDLSGYQVSSVNPTISLKMDINKFFSSPNPYELYNNPTHVHDPNAPILPVLVQNMSNMFSVKSITQ